MAKKAIKQSTKQDTSQILAGGILLTMDDDLRNLQSRMSRELRNRKQRKVAKIMPAVEKTVLSAPREKPTPSKKKPGFLSVFKRVFKKERKIARIKEAPVVEKKDSKELPQSQVRAKKPLSPVQKTSYTQKEPPTKPTPQKQKILITKEEADDIIRRKEEFKRQIASIDKELSGFISENRTFNERIQELKKQKQQLQEALKLVLKQEAKLEADEKVVEAKESATESVEQKHEFESKRWAIEEQRRKQEQSKWSLGEKAELNKKEIETLESNFKAISDKQTELKARKQKIIKRLEQAELFKKRELAGVAMKAIEKQLVDIKYKEEEITQKEREIEQKQEKAKTTEEQKALGQARWDLEEQRKNIEQKRWNTEKRKKELTEEIKEMGGLPETIEISKKTESTEPKDEEFVPIKRRIREWKPVKHILRDEKRSTDEISKEKKQELLEELAKRQNLTKKQTPSDPEGRGYQEGKEGEAKVFMPSRDLPKEEIASKIKQWRKQRENEKKINIIQEQAQNHKNGAYVPKSKGPISKAAILQKLSTISSKEKKQREEFLAKVSGKPRVVNIKARELGGEIVFRPIIRRSSVLQKILARIVFLILILSFIIAVVWLLYTYIFYDGDNQIILPEISEQDNTQPVDITSTSTDSDTEPITEEDIEDETPTSSDPDISDIIVPEVVLPKPLISVSDVNVVEFYSLIPVSDLLSNIVFVNENTDGFTHIIFQDKETKEALNFSDFLKVFEIASVQGFLENIEVPVTLFVYSLGGKANFGFVSKVRNSSDLINSVKAWEETIEKDTDSLFETLGKAQTPLSDIFLTAIYKDEGFRYQTFTRQDFGICYAVTHGGHFIFTTSYETMKKVLDNLDNNK